MKPKQTDLINCFYYTIAAIFFPGSSFDALIQIKREKNCNQ